MIYWNIDSPRGDTILARLSERWYPRYAVLYYNKQSGKYYDECGEEVPLSAIMKWTPIESEEEK